MTPVPAALRGPQNPARRSAPVLLGSGATLQVIFGKGAAPARPRAPSPSRGAGAVSVALLPSLGGARRPGAPDKRRWGHSTHRRGARNVPNTSVARGCTCDPGSRPRCPELCSWQFPPQESQGPAARPRSTGHSEAATLRLTDCAPTSAEARRRRGGDGARPRRAVGGQAGGWVRRTGRRA